MTGPRPLTDEQIAAAVARGRKRLDRRPVPRVELATGDRVWFPGDEGAWSVRAVSADGRWVICTQSGGTRFDYLRELDVPTVLYTVLDFDDGVRGPDNYRGLGYETEEDIAANLAMFERGDAEVSVRSDVHLEIARVERAGGAS